MGLGYEVIFHFRLLDSIYCTATFKLNTIVAVFRWLNNTGANKPRTLTWTNVGERLSLGQFRHLQYRRSLHHGRCNDLMNPKWSSAKFSNRSSGSSDACWTCQTAERVMPAQNRCGASFHSMKLIGGFSTFADTFVSLCLRPWDVSCT